MTTVYEVLSDYCEDQDWRFYFGRLEHANLKGLEDDKIHCYLLLQRRSPTFNSYGITNYQYTIEIALLVRGDLTKEPKEKYLENLKRLYTADSELSLHLKGCGLWNVQNWQSVEVINLLDDAGDGLQITADLIQKYRPYAT